MRQPRQAPQWLSLLSSETSVVSLCDCVRSPGARNARSGPAVLPRAGCAFLLRMREFLCALTIPLILSKGRYARVEGPAVRVEWPARAEHERAAYLLVSGSLKALALLWPGARGRAGIVRARRRMRDG